MTMRRGSLEAWTLQQVDDDGRRNYLKASNNQWLATKNDGEQGLYLSSSPTAGSIWELIPVAGESNGRFYLRSAHGKHLSSLDDKEQTLYMSPSQKEWERWRVIHLSAARKDSGQGQNGPLHVLLNVSGKLESCTVEEAVEKLFDCKPTKFGVPLRHHNPEQTLFYGRWFGLSRAPAVFLEASCEAVAQYLLEDPTSPWADVEANPPAIPVQSCPPWAAWGFEASDDEKLLKADWHAVPHLPFGDEVFVPRRAKSAQICRAPTRTLAFIHAFRAINRPCWAAIAEALAALKRAREEEDEDYKKENRGSLLGTFKECFRNGRHFGVVEAQVRWGGEALRQPSHMDGATSLVHMGFTLGGHRTLRAGVFPDRFTESVGKNVWDEKLWLPEHLQEMDMTLGSAYISSPFCFEHAVQYEPCSSQEPIIALMFRFGFPKDLGKMINNMRTDDMLDITTTIAVCLKTASSRGQLRMPSLGEVRQGEAYLEKMDSEASFMYGLTGALIPDRANKWGRNSSWGLLGSTKAVAHHVDGDLG
eukprot:CAMPEP_0171088418 /NCGR_PEP_ID=MMETSP0766_2-20121228/20765_1 /TAXON_ID=439317 /ORGANISM="Gambierdiscus australes, Strain CAWD 149" /LENGTH=531 /DNA_ID=CAMNT_0011546215 /DNA_START=154 /DNA_END=1748 /DNA_ORIENTATION=+